MKYYCNFNELFSIQIYMYNVMYSCDGKAECSAAITPEIFCNIINVFTVTFYYFLSPSTINLMHHCWIKVIHIKLTDFLNGTVHILKQSK